jgi:hypothetical protein
VKRTLLRRRPAADPHQIQITEPVDFDAGILEEFLQERRLVPGLSADSSHGKGPGRLPLSQDPSQQFRLCPDRRRYPRVPVDCIPRRKTGDILVDLIWRLVFQDVSWHCAARS